jgi:hypothetical protein
LYGVVNGITNTPARPAPTVLYAVEVTTGDRLKRPKSLLKRSDPSSPVRTVVAAVKMEISV